MGSSHIAEDSLLFKTIQATKSVSLVVVLKIALQFIVQLILVRKLAPEIFGTFIFTQMVVSFLSVFANVQGKKVIIREKRQLKDTIDVCFSIELILAVFLMLIIIVFAPFIAQYLNKPTIVRYLQLLALTLLTTAFINSPRAIFERNLNFKEANISTFFGVTGNAIVSISLALLGYGIWALIFGLIVGQAVELFILWRMLPFRPRLFFDKNIFKKVLKFGLPLTLAAIVTFGYSNIDKFMIGKMISDKQLGYYWFAFSIPNFLVIAQTSIGLAIFPAFANASDNNQLKRGFNRATKTSAVLFFLPCAAVLTLGEPIIKFVFGIKWLPALSSFKIFTLLAVIRAVVVSHWSALFVARGKTTVILYIALLYFLLISSLGYLVIPKYGISGMAAVVLFVILSSIPISKFTLRNILRYSYIQMLGPQVLVFCLTVAFGFLLANLALKSIITFSLALFLMGAFYVTCFYFIDREMFIWLKGCAKRII